MLLQPQVLSQHDEIEHVAQAAPFRHLGEKYASCHTFPRSFKFGQTLNLELTEHSGTDSLVIKHLPRLGKSPSDLRIFMFMSECRQH